MQISFRTGVTLAGAGPFDADSLHTAMGLAPRVVAADGGADSLAALGVVPEAVIGDMDSLRGSVPDKATVISVTEQETTDFEKCLMRIDAPFCIGVGFSGGRLDHTLAALSVLLAHPDKRVVLLGDTDVTFVAPPRWTMPITPGARVSFYPLLPCRGVASSGLRWSVEGLEMRAGGQIGTSNEAIATQVSASFDPVGAVTILPKRYLGPVIESLGRASRTR